MTWDGIQSSKFDMVRTYFRTYFKVTWFEVTKFELYGLSKLLLIIAIVLVFILWVFPCWSAVFAHFTILGKSKQRIPRQWITRTTFIIIFSLFSIDSGDSGDMFGRPISTCTMTGVLKSLAASMMALMVEKEEQLKAGKAICNQLYFTCSQYKAINKYRTICINHNFCVMLYR